MQPGQQIGRWTLIEHFSAPPGGTRWVCRCECGAQKSVAQSSLRRGDSRSCGCLARENSRKAHITHGDAAGGRRKLYGVWLSMKNRCSRPNVAAYPDYGGRGIVVCDEWVSSYEAFRDWAYGAGYAEGLTIDRVDNGGDYTPENCRWVPFVEQARNRRNNIWITAWGETKLLADWVKDDRCQVTRAAIKKRLAKGMTPEDAISTPATRPGTSTILSVSDPR